MCIKRSVVWMLVCGVVAAAPIDVRAGWDDQYDTVAYGSNGGAAGNSSGGSAWGSYGR